MRFHLDCTKDVVPKPIYNPIFRRQFQIGDSIHRKNKKKFKSLLKKPSFRSHAADFAASIGLGIVASGNSEAKHLVNSQIACCRDVVLGLGFDELTEKNTHEILRKEQKVPLFILVTGCQNEYMLNERINCLVDFCRGAYRTGVNFEIIFSGRCPIDDIENICIPNEAVRMENMFIAKLKESKEEILPAIQLLHRTEEDDSSNTIQNVTNFLCCPQIRDAKEMNFVVISSTFHLIRIAQEFLKKLKTDNEDMKKPEEKEKKDMINNMKDKVRNLMLIGSEYTVLNVVSFHDYFKNMFYDLYREMME